MIEKTSNPICNYDCQHCTYPDCVNNTIRDVDIYVSKQLDRKINIDKPSDFKSTRQYRYSKTEKGKATQRRYEQTEKRKAAKRAYAKRYSEAHREQNRIKQKLYYELHREEIQLRRLQKQLKKEIKE